VFTGKKCNRGRARSKRVFEFSNRCAFIIAYEDILYANLANRKVIANSLAALCDHLVFSTPPIPVGEAADLFLVWACKTRRRRKRQSRCGT
jgi:hypothetical protein